MDSRFFIQQLLCSLLAFVLPSGLVNILSGKDSQVTKCEKIAGQGEGAFSLSLPGPPGPAAGTERAGRVAAFLD